MCLYEDISWQILHLVKLSDSEGMVKEVEKSGGGVWREGQVNGGGGGGGGKRQPLGLTVLASTFGEKLCEQSLIQTFSRERVPRLCTAVSC